MVIVGYRLIIMFLPPLTSAYNRNSDTWELYIPGYSNLDNILRSGFSQEVVMSVQCVLC